MEKEDKRAVRPHQIRWNDRREGHITGVKEILSFDDNTIVLDTELGRLTIRGKELRITRLFQEQGEAEIEGCPESLTYTAAGQGRKLVRRMFQ